ncbi:MULTISPECIES: efflux RND transporter permease subunit [Asticcacaulis]|uniref:efflux RND transporter permease subunit n=1 Tax=Asticcacaulis TaxID=76890 RepID=UPI001AE58BCB|nr:MULTISPECIES: efflux RND transporter permease subunit [Asticcacaulis]MBP2160682.1 HAE1 family hydrophobic/amphiphilic exporter-1 [Asticcacaulis solisilvae]MDR6801727.1 HAE1 family hydrophobic/amphiphilic exporter-1 [Asticcacaulis sp. BE141]
MSTQGDHYERAAKASTGGFQISSWSIRNPIPTIVFFLVMTVAGWMGFNSMRVNNWPDVDFPMVVVTVIRSGAAPTELENQVTRIVEDSVAGLGGVRHSQSYVNEGASTTVVTFQLDVDLEKATNDVRNAVAGVRGNLPADVQDPIVSRVENAQGQALLTYVIRADNMTPEQLSWYVDNDVAKRVLAVKGVSQLNRKGGVNREIRIELDPAKLAAQGVTAAAISNQLRSENVNMPGGRFNVGTTEQNIRTVGGANSVAELSERRIALPNGSSVRLGDLGSVVDSWSEPRARARYNGEEVVGFDIQRTRGTSEAHVAKQVREVIAKLKDENKNLRIEQVASSVDEVNLSFHSSMEALIIGALLAVFVVWLFLRDWRATFVSAMAMPMSLLPTFFVMWMTNQSFNVVTLLALALTVGILVDDAIVEIENIVRHIREGKPPYQAAIEAADEIGLAVVATTATLIAVFAPTGFMPGIVGQFFKSFAIACCVSVFFSLVVARTLTPLMGAYLLRDHGNKHKEDKPFWMDGYLKTLRWSLRHKVVVVLLSFGFFAGSIAMLVMIPSDNIPAGDVSMSVMNVALPPGSTLQETDDAVKRISADLQKRDEVTSTFVTMEMEKATIIANLVPQDKRDLSQSEFEQAFSKSLDSYPGVHASFGAEGGGGTGVAYILVSENAQSLTHAAVRLQQEMAGLPELTNVSSEDNLTRPEIVITPKPEQAALLGVSTADISSAARVATMGDIDQILAKYNEGDRQIPIRVMLKSDARAEVTNLSTMMVPTRAGTSVPLSAVADIRFGAGPIQINRLDRVRSATVKADLNGVPTGLADKAVEGTQVMKDIRAGMKNPSAAKYPGVRVQVNPNVEDFADMGKNFVVAILTGIGLMYVVLVLLFGSFSHPLTIILALPLSFGGAFIGLILCGMSMSMPAFIGLIMLVGIAAKNSILLVEYAMVAIKGGMKREDALIEASRKRARPIIMTTVAMGAGMIPVAVGIDSFRQPMAVAVIGGLITSTLLSLLYVPVVYVLIDKVSNFFIKLFAPLFRAQGKDQPETKPAE